MSLVHDRCICLRKVEYSETSQILTLLGREHGVLHLIAKGAHRRTKAGASKFDGGIDLLDHGDAVFSLRLEKDLAPLTEWHLRDGHLELRRNLRGLYLAQYAGELTSLVIERHDPHPEIFDRLEQALRELHARPEEVFLVFELDLLREAGYLPNLSHCTLCRAPFSDRTAWYFSPQTGGLVCRGCEAASPDRMAVDPKLIAMIHHLMRLPRMNGSTQKLPRLTRHQTDPVNRMLAAHIEHTLGRRLYLPKFVMR